MAGRKEGSYHISVIGGIAKNFCTKTRSLPEEGQTVYSEGFNIHNGGKGANSAIATFRLSHLKKSPRSSGAATPTVGEVLGCGDIKVYMVGAVGNDEYGPGLKDALAKNGVDTKNVDVLDGQRTGINSITVCPGGETYAIHTPCTNELLQHDWLSSMRNLAGGNLPDLVITQLEIGVEALEHVMKRIANSGIDVILNPSPAYSLGEEIFHDLTHLIINKSEARILIAPDDGSDDGDSKNSNKTLDLNKAADELLGRGARNVVIMLGKDGAFYAQRLGAGTYETLGIHENEIKDTTGAEDAFIGAYAVEWIRQKHQGQNWNIKAAVQLACKAAETAMRKGGCQEAIPWADDL